MNDPFGINRSLSVATFTTGEEASANGYDYKTWEPRPIPLKMDKAVVVRNGMKSGASTVDLLMTDENGNQYVALITGNLLNMLKIVAGWTP